MDHHGSTERSGRVGSRNTKVTRHGCGPRSRSGMITAMHMHHSGQSNIPQTMVGISFKSPYRAREFLVAVSGLAAAGELRLKDAVTVVKDDFGRTVVHETMDPTPVRAALTGAMWAGLFGSSSVDPSDGSRDWSSAVAPGRSAPR